MIDAKLKTACQLLAFIKNMDSQCTRGYWLLKTHNFDKDVEVEEPSSFSSANYTSG